MATIQQPHIEFTNNTQSRVKVSFQVNFAVTELGGFLAAIFSYSAQVLFKVIRVVPQPIVSGSPPPPLPDPVTLNVTALSVQRPSSGNAQSLNTEFAYTFAVNSNLITDHLHAEIRLRRRLIFWPFNTLLDSKRTNDLVLTVGDLASPQPNGAIIP